MGMKNMNILDCNNIETGEFEKKNSITTKPINHFTNDMSTTIVSDKTISLNHMTDSWSHKTKQ